MATGLRKCLVLGALAGIGKNQYYTRIARLPERIMLSGRKSPVLTAIMAAAGNVAAADINFYNGTATWNDTQNIDGKIVVGINGNTDLTLGATANYTATGIELASALNCIRFVRFASSHLDG